jgi:CheY-like chemotaxis protein
MNDMWKSENNKVRKILIVDDHPAMRLGLRSILESEEDLEICGEAEDASTALAKIEEEKPDLVIIDLMLESESGLELIKDIKTRWPDRRWSGRPCLKRMFPTCSFVVPSTVVHPNPWASRVSRTGSSRFSS